MLVAAPLPVLLAETFRAPRWLRAICAVGLTGVALYAIVWSLSVLPHLRPIPPAPA